MRLWATSRNASRRTVRRVSFAVRAISKTIADRRSVYLRISGVEILDRADNVQIWGRSSPGQSLKREEWEVAGSLYERLGGIDAITAVVHDFRDRVAGDA